MKLSSQLQGVTERRLKPRIHCTYPAIVVGIGRGQNKFRGMGTVDNLSTAGLHLHTSQAVQVGTRLLVVTWLSDLPAPSSDLVSLAARGTVVRIDRGLDGSCGLAIKFERYKFL